MLPPEHTARTSLEYDQRLAFTAFVRGQAAEVAALGYERSPKGWCNYWAVNTANLKIYIGMTNDVEGRIACHKNDARNNCQFPFHRALRKYGEKSFVFVPIEYFDDESSAAAGERKAIAFHRSQDRYLGYNVADGGPGIGSGGAKQVHARPKYRAWLLATRFERARKAADTRRRNKAARAAEAATLPLLDSV